MSHDERDATIELLLDENAKLKAAVTAEAGRTRDSIADWLDVLSIESCTGDLARRIRNCEDIDPP